MNDGKMPKWVQFAILVMMLFTIGSFLMLAVVSTWRLIL